VRLRSKSARLLVGEITSVPKIEQGTVVGVFGIARDVTSLKTLALLEERERISIDLHDGVIQSLFAVRLGLAAQERLIAGRSNGAAGPPNLAPVRRALRQALADVDQIVQDIRNYVHGLRLHNLEGRDLRRGLEALTAELRINTLVHPSLEVDLDPDVERQLDRSIVSTLLHVTREATSNVIRHAAANEVTIRVEQWGERCVQLTVCDDGRGFNPQIANLTEASSADAEGQGLRQMMARAELIGGRLTVASAPGGGTEVRLQVPTADGGAVAGTDAA
jgi:signal transduction histidine kinase